MRTSIRKWYVDYEKEEQWLNYMAAKGFALIYFSWGKYVFEDTAPGEYIYRIELLNSMPQSFESKQYIEFMEEMGVEQVSSWIRWVYFRKKATDGPFDIYSDIDSKIKHYRRILKMTGILAISNLIVSFFNLSLGLSALNERGMVIPNLYLPLINFFVFFILIVVSSRYYFRSKKLKKDKMLKG